MPGDVETIIAKANTSEAVKARLMAEAGLDQPITTQFGIYLENLLTGDFPEKKVLFDFHSCLPGEHYAASRSKWYFFACVQMLCSTPIVR